jgi:hypothetical protein
MRALLNRLLNPVLEEGRRTWRTGGPPVRVAVVVGTLLMVAGILHGLGFLVLGGPWQGPVAWRKPFAFGLSFGLAALTVAWITTHLALGRRARWLLLGPLSVAVTVEVAWVSVQRARGVPSHFNNSTPADALAFNVAGGGSVAVVVLILLALTVLSWARSATSPVLASSIRSGLAILLVAQSVGGTMIERGIASQAAGGVATHSISPDGDLKLSHAVAMHAIQVLPLLAMWLLAGSLPGRLARTLVRAASGGYVLLTAATLLLAVQGRSVLEPTASALALGAAGLVLTGSVAAVAISTVARGVPVGASEPASKSPAAS